MIVDAPPQELRSEMSSFWGRDRRLPRVHAFRRRLVQAGEGGGVPPTLGCLWPLPRFRLWEEGARKAGDALNVKLKAAAVQEKQVRFYNKDERCPQRPAQYGEGFILACGYGDSYGATAGLLKVARVFEVIQPLI